MHPLILTCTLVFGVPLGAQNIDLSSLEGLREKADSVVSVSIGPELLAFANVFLSGEDEEEAAALEVIEDLEAIEVRVYEFDEGGQYDSVELDAIWQQLDVEGWDRIVEIDEEGERVGVWMYMEPAAAGTSRTVGGMAVLVEEDDEVVLVNIVGSISPANLAALGAQFDFSDLADLSGLADLADLGDDDEDEDEDEHDDDEDDDDNEDD